uniref:Uncharacterized protein n=1 Tax=Oryza brachyantha TaxID=4533 RepID=J3N1F2_ORYBR
MADPEDELNGANNVEWTYENGRVRLPPDLPGCLKFKLRGLQNKYLLQEIFEDIRNIGNDHWNPARGDLPEKEVNGVGDDDSGDEDFTPPAKRAKRARGKEVEKPKSSGGNWFYEQMTRFVDNQEKTSTTIESFVKR